MIGVEAEFGLIPVPVLYIGPRVSVPTRSCYSDVVIGKETLHHALPERQCASRHLSMWLSRIIGLRDCPRLERRIRLVEREVPEGLVWVVKYDGPRSIVMREDHGTGLRVACISGHAIQY